VACIRPCIIATGRSFVRRKDPIMMISNSLGYFRVVNSSTGLQRSIATSLYFDTMAHFTPLSYYLYFTFGTFLTISIPIAAPNRTLLTLSPPICVNGGEFPDWGGRPSPIVVNECAKAMDILVQRVQENLFTYYDFYSSPMLPSPLNGYPLPQGAGYGWCSIPHGLH